MTQYSCTVGYIFDVLDRIQFASFFIVIWVVLFTFFTLMDSMWISEFKKKYEDKEYPLKKIIFAWLIALCLVIFIP